MEKMETDFSKISKIDLIEMQHLIKIHIDSGNRYGYENGDPGHPSYRMGSLGDSSRAMSSIGAAKDSLFNLLAGVEAEMKKREIGPENKFIASSWPAYCKYVISVYDKMHSG